MFGPADVLYPELREQAQELVLDDVRQRSDQQQLRRSIGRARGHDRHQRGKAGILAFGEGRFDPAARIVENANLTRVLRAEALGRLAKVQLDHFGRARADQE